VINEGLETAAVTSLRAGDVWRWAFSMLTET